MKDFIEALNILNKYNDGKLKPSIIGSALEINVKVVSCEDYNKLIELGWFRFVGYGESGNWATYL